MVNNYYIDEEDKKDLGEKLNENIFNFLGYCVGDEVFYIKNHKLE